MKRWRKRYKLISNSKLKKGDEVKINYDMTPLSPFFNKIQNIVGDNWNKYDDILATVKRVKIKKKGSAIPRHDWFGSIYSCPFIILDKDEIYYEIQIIFPNEINGIEFEFNNHYLKLKEN
jgi:hypothetical protein